MKTKSYDDMSVEELTQESVMLRVLQASLIRCNEEPGFRNAKSDKLLAETEEGIVKVAAVLDRKAAHPAQARQANLRPQRLG